MVCTKYLLMFLLDVKFSGASAQTNAYTEGTWYIHINDLNCTGEEDSIWDCPQNELSGYSCNHYQDASVICQCKSLTIL